MYQKVYYTLLILNFHFKFWGIKNPPLNTDVAPRLKRFKVKSSQKILESSPMYLSLGYGLVNGQFTWHKLKVYSVSQTWIDVSPKVILQIYMTYWTHLKKNVDDTVQSTYYYWEEQNTPNNVFYWWCGCYNCYTQWTAYIL